MTQLLSAPSSTEDAPRCRHLTVNGRQCRHRVLDTQSDLCFRHARPLPMQSDSEDLSPDLLPQLSPFDSAVDINQFLARLLVLVTKGRVSPRRASVLAYITNQLLHSHHAIERKQAIDLKNEPFTVDFGDLPRPPR